MKPMEHQPVPERYVWQWLAFWSLAAVVVGWVAVSWRAPSFPLQVPRVAPAHGVDWFLIMKVPEVPSDKGQAAAAEARFADWLQGLREAGFQPMALSTVLSWLDQRRPLPQKTVVLLFHPGYRRTYETYAPLLAARGYPALWLTDRTALSRGDYRYLSYEAIRRMRASNLWDVAWFGQISPVRNALLVELEGSAASGHPSRRLALAPRDGTRGLNRATHAYFLHHLRANPAWSARELVDRLLVETPVEGPSDLTVRRIGVQLWGAAKSADASLRRQPFDLQAPMDTRGAFVSWPSTRQQPDFQLRLQAVSGLGETWVLLRSNRASGQGVRIGFLEDLVVVEQDEAGQRMRLATLDRPAPTSEPLAATIALIGGHLELSMDGQPVAQLSLKAPTNAQGMVELQVSDQVRGAAELRSASLLFIPFQHHRHDTIQAPPQPLTAGLSPVAGHHPTARPSPEAFHIKP